MNYAERRIRRSLRKILTDYPFFGSVLLRLPLQQDTSKESIATDGNSLYFNPDWIESIDLSSLNMSMCHLAMALALKHHTRRGDRDYSTWQLASDLATRPMLKDSGFDCKVVYNLPVEDIFNKIEEEPSQEEPSQGEHDGESSYGNSRSSCGEVMDHPKEFEGEPVNIKDVERQWDKVLHQAARISLTYGQLPDSIKEVATSMHVSNVDYAAILANLLSEITKDDYSWSVPDKRFIDSGLYLPSLHCRKLKTLVFAIDTSGSLETDLLGDIWRELVHCVEMTSIDNVIVVQCDYVIQSVEEYASTDLPDDFNILGRGGTRFSPVFEYIDEAMNEAPTCLIYYTDLLCGDFPLQEPDYPVVWMSTIPKEDADYQRPPFGHVICVK